MKRESKPVVLTPRLFRRLDRIARKTARVPLQVMNPDFMGSFAEASAWSFGLYEHDKCGAKIVKTSPLICIANQIDLSRVGRSYYGIVWRELPRTKLYEFLVWHEVCHVINGDSSAGFSLQVESIASIADKTIVQKLRTAQEIRANRYAWEKVFPGEPLPQSLTEGWGGCTTTLEKCAGYYLPMRERPVIPLTSNKLVPEGHKRGIPFVGAKLAA